MKRVVVTDATFPGVMSEAVASFERKDCEMADEVTAAVRAADVAVVQFAR